MDNDHFIRLNNLFDTEEEMRSELHSATSLDSFNRWIHVRGLISEILVQLALGETAKKFHVTLFHNPVNPASYAHFLRSDTDSKTMDIQLRSEKSGFLSGFLKPENLPTGLDSKPIYFDAVEAKYWVVRDSNEMKLTTGFDESSSLHAATNSGGNFITSDIDLVMIASREYYGNPGAQSLGFGELMELEYSVIDFANNTFRNLISDFFPHFKNYRFQLFTHGPSSRFSRSKQSHLHFPMIHYSENGRKGSFGCESQRENSIQQFISHLEELQQNGFSTEVNPLWGLYQCV